MTARAPATRVLVCAHRHGNELDSLRAAESVAVDFVEVDVHLFRGRLDARHTKTIGPIPLLWDRGRRPLWNPPRQSFDEIVAAAQPATVFYVDLKGWRRRLSHKAAAALEGRANYVVSSRAWWLLTPFQSVGDAVVLRSIGAPWQLRWFLRWSRSGATDGVSIQRDLLTPAILSELRTSAAHVFVWGVTSNEDARELHQWGVDGVIVDDLELASALLRGDP